MESLIIDKIKEEANDSDLRLIEEGTFRKNILMDKKLSLGPINIVGVGRSETDKLPKRFEFTGKSLIYPAYFWINKKGEYGVKFEAERMLFDNVKFEAERMLFDNVVSQ